MYLGLSMLSSTIFLFRIFRVLIYFFAFRWACSTIERGYSSVDAYELSAIASFHHPQGFVYGYIRMVIC